MDTKYRVKKSPVVKMTTVMAMFLFTCTEIELIYKSITIFTWGWILSVVLFNILVFVLIISIPLSVSIKDSGIFLNKIRGSIFIGFDQINSISSFNPVPDSKIFGNGGFGGYVGWFSNSSFGWYVSYIGDAKQAFIIKTKTNKGYAFSCENSASVVEIIKAHIK